MGSSAATGSNDTSTGAVWTTHYTSPNGVVTEVEGASIDAAGDVHTLVRYDSPDLGHNELAKLDSHGAVQWRTVMKLDGGGTDELVRLSVTPDGQIAAGGTWYSADRRTSAMIVYRLDAAGNVLARWQGDTTSSFYDVRLCSDGNAVVAGAANGQARVVALGANGSVAWNATYAVPGSTSTTAIHVRCAHEGGVIVAGTSFVSSVPALTLFSFDGAGTLRWTYAAPAGIGAPQGLALDGSDAAYAVTTRQSDAGSELAIVAVDSLGRSLWTYTSGGTTDAGASLAVDANGNVTAVGARTTNGAEHALSVALDPRGNVRWTHDEPFTSGKSSAAKACSLDDVGHALVAATVGTDAGLLFYDATGTELWRQELASTTPLWAAVANGMGYVVGGSSTGLVVSAFASNDDSITRDVTPPEARVRFPGKNATGAR